MPYISFKTTKVLTLQQELDLNKMEKSLNQTLVIGGSVTGAAVIVAILCLCLN